MLELWMIYVIISVIAVIVEIFVPSLFCINFAIAGIITAIISIFWGDFTTTLVIFMVLSLLSIIFIRPILKKLLTRSERVDFNADYIGKVVKVIEPVTKMSGAITVYDERWEARIKDGEEIPVGTDVKIVANESTTLFVERI